MNLDEDAELDRMLADVDLTEDGAANDELGLSKELIEALVTPTLDASRRGVGSKVVLVQRTKNHMLWRHAESSC